MRKYYGKLPDVIQAEFQKEYNSAVRREAEYMLHSMQRTAESNDYDFDNFFQDVIAKMQQLKRKGE